jgi:hypothetical protein
MSVLNDVLRLGDLEYIVEVGRGQLRVDFGI